MAVPACRCPRGAKRSSSATAAWRWARSGVTWARPLAHSEAGDVWVLGEGADDRAAALRSLQAPEFSLPDPTGAMHSLSELRGKKVLLVSWASW